MFPLEEDCTDNHNDVNNQISQNSDNCLTAINNFSALQAAETERNQQLMIRKCKSESSFKESSKKVQKMGTTLSRSKSCENFETDRIVIEPLMPDKLVAKDDHSLCGFDDSEEEYELLENSDDIEDEQEITEGDKDNDDGLIEEETHSDGQAIIQNANTSSVISEWSPQNAVLGDLSKASTTSMFVKIDEVDKEENDLRFLRYSMPNKSINNDQAFLPKTAQSLDSPLDETIYSAAVKSTTLPKTRSRLCESRLRHSLRKAIDFTQSRKYSSFSNGSRNATEIIPDTNEQANMGKNSLSLSSFPIFHVFICF